MSQGGGALACGVVRANEASRGAGAERLRVREAAPPLDGRAALASSGCALGERLEGAGERARGRRTLGRGPALEPVGSPHVEAIEERARVELHRRFMVPSAGGIAEVGDVALDQLRVQSQLGGRQKQLRELPLLANGVDELLERRPRARLVALRPEVREHRLATRAELARGGEYGEERQRLALT